MSVKILLCRLGFCGVVCLSISLYLTMSVWTIDDEPSKREFKSVKHNIQNFHLHQNTTHINSTKTSNSKAGTEKHQSQGTISFVNNDFGECKEKHNFAFIKCMKCATESMGTIFRRFGYIRNLSFVTPVKKRIYLGWPFLMTKYDYRPSSRGYNIIMEHSIYNKTFMENLMPNDTVYISIIREPFSHVKSSIHYFSIFKIAGVKGEDPLTEYFHNLDKYEAVYKSPKQHGRDCIPDGFSITKNLLSHCLGMPLGFPPGREDISRDQKAVQRYIEQLDRDFYLILLVEYFHESLVLLKRKMCWTFHDILYKEANKGNYKYKAKESHLDLVSIHRNWSSADYQLYDHFNKTFWKQVNRQGPDFFDEVAEYGRVHANVTRFCKHGTGEYLAVKESKWNRAFKVSRIVCGMQREYLLRRIQMRHEHDEKILLAKENLAAHPEPRALC